MAEPMSGLLRALAIAGGTVCRYCHGSGISGAGSCSPCQGTGYDIDRLRAAASPPPDIDRLTADLAAARLERDGAVDGKRAWSAIAKARVERIRAAESTVAQQAARIAGLEGALRRIADSTGDPARPDYLTRTGLVVVANDALSGGPSAIQPCSVVAAAQRFVAQFYARGEGWLSYDDIRPLRDALNGSPTPVSAPVRTALRAAWELSLRLTAANGEADFRRRLDVLPSGFARDLDAAEAALRDALAALPPEIMEE